MQQITGWRKASYSGNQTACVEVGRTPQGGAAVRDTKDRGAGHFAVNRQQWTQFVNAIKAGQLPA